MTGVLSAVQVRTAVAIPLDVDGTEACATVTTFAGLPSGLEHLAVSFGEIPARGVPRVRVHSECLTGDVLASLRCDCGPQLRESLRMLSRTDGVLLYLRQEGRGIGLYNKIDAYVLQDAGLDTYEANHAIGRPGDARNYGEAAAMLQALGISTVDLATNNPDKIAQLREHGITVRHILPMPTVENAHNSRYLRAKRDLTHHTLHLSDDEGLSRAADRAG